MTRPLLSLYLSHAPPLSFSAVARAGRHMIISGGLGNDGASSDTFIFDMLEHSIRVWDTQGLINPTFGHGAFWHESSGELFVFGGAQQVREGNMTQFSFVLLKRILFFLSRMAGNYCIESIAKHLSHMSSWH